MGTVPRLQTKCVARAGAWGPFCTRAVQPAALRTPETRASPPLGSRESHLHGGRSDDRHRLSALTCFVCVCDSLLQLNIYFPIYENPEEWPSPDPSRGCRPTFPQLTPKFQNRLPAPCLLRHWCLLINSSCHGDGKGTLPMLQWASDFIWNH